MRDSFHSDIWMTTLNEQAMLSSFLFRANSLKSI